MKNLKAKVLTAGLTAAMVLSMGAPVFAADTTKVVTDGSNATIEKDLAIAKQGVTSPVATYTFNFTAFTQGAPEISSKSVKSDEKSTNADGKITLTTSALLSTEDINKLTAAGPGIYEYNLKEATTFADADAEHVLTSDDSIYRIKVKVAYSNNTLTVTGITAQKVTSERAASSENDNDKVTAITFNNKYTEYGNDDPTPNPDDPDSPTPKNEEKGLVISKTIGTTGGEDKNAKFTYEIEFTPDNVNSGLTSSVTNGIDVYTDAELSTKATTVTDSGTYYFQLGNGEEIDFKIPAGTSYKVTETKGDYTAKVVTTTDGTTAAVQTTNVVSSYVGEKSNSVAFTNTKDSSPLTGIVNNYGGLIAVVAIAAGGMIVLTLRRRQDA